MNTPKPLCNHHAAGTLIALIILCLTHPRIIHAQGATDYRAKSVPSEDGFRLYLISDMEGMGSVVHIGEVIAGTEGERYKSLSGPDYWPHYRRLATEEANAVIRGARRAGARSFVVNEGHGGNRFANLLPWELDQEAILIRGYPKPLVMSTGIDDSFDTMMIIGAHSSRGGVLAHNYAFDEFAVNGVALNEVGINALVAGESGVAVSLVSGDDELIREARAILGDGFVAVTTKIAVGRTAAITYSPKRVQEMLEKGAAEAVQKQTSGSLKPFTLNRPYDVRFTLRTSYPDAVVEGVDSLIDEYGFEKVSGRSYRFVAGDARSIGYLIDAIELVVLP